MAFTDYHIPAHNYSKTGNKKLRFMLPEYQVILYNRNSRQEVGPSFMQNQTVYQNQNWPVYHQLCAGDDYVCDYAEHEMDRTEQRRAE